MLIELGVPCAFENRLLSPLMCPKVQDAMEMKCCGLRARKSRHVLVMRDGPPFAMGFERRSHCELRVRRSLIPKRTSHVSMLKEAPGLV
jgi:hypothetical protein